MSSSQTPGLEIVRCIGGGGGGGRERHRERFTACSRCERNKNLDGREFIAQALPPDGLPVHPKPLMSLCLELPSRKRLDIAQFTLALNLPYDGNHN